MKRWWPKLTLRKSWLEVRRYARYGRPIPTNLSSAWNDTPHVGATTQWDPWDASPPKFGSRGTNTTWSPQPTFMTGCYFGDFWGLKLHKISIFPGLHPKPHWGNLQRSSDPLAGAWWGGDSLSPPQESHPHSRTSARRTSSTSLWLPHHKK